MKRTLQPKSVDRSTRDWLANLRNPGSEKRQLKLPTFLREHEKIAQVINANLDVAKFAIATAEAAGQELETLVQNIGKETERVAKNIDRELQRAAKDISREANNAID